MERLNNHQDFLRLIPTETLINLDPFRFKLHEVMTSQSDFAHLKYHPLDAISLLRYCEKDLAEFDQQLSRGRLMGWITSDDIHERPLLGESAPKLLSTPDYFRVERAIYLHDVGKVFEKLVGLNPKEHHLASLFVALYVDGDPLVCQAVYDHIKNVLPQNASDVSRHTRDLDRMAGSGYIGIIRLLATYYGFSHPTLSKTDEDEIIEDGIMVTFNRPVSMGNENKAKKFFWDNVFPFYENQGSKGIGLVGTLAKISLDRIFGRDLRHVEILDSYEKAVLKMDGKARVIEPVQGIYRSLLRFKIQNTLEIMGKTRGSDPERSWGYFDTLTEREKRIYQF